MIEPKHIRHCTDRTNESWCGIQLTNSDWSFENIDQAVYAKVENSHTPICNTCVECIVNTLSLYEDLNPQTDEDL